MNLASECVFVPMSLLSLFLCARIWSQEETMTSIRNWSGERKILASPVCGVVCGPLVTLTNQNGLNITLTLWHNITPCADRQRSFACVLLLRGLLVFVFKGGEWKRLEDWVVFFFVFFERVCLCSLFSDTSSVRADHLPTSQPHPAVTSSLFTAAAKGLL